MTKLFLLIAVLSSGEHITIDQSLSETACISRAEAGPVFTGPVTRALQGVTMICEPEDA